MTDLNCFSFQIDAHVAHLVLNRPEAMNTMGPVFWRELDGVLSELHNGNAARALVISSTGKHFSAGMALDVFGGAIAMDDASPEGSCRDLRPAGRPAGPPSRGSKTCASP